MQQTGWQPSGEALLHPRWRSLLLVQSEEVCSSDSLHLLSKESLFTYSVSMRFSTVEESPQLLETSAGPSWFCTKGPINGRITDGWTSTCSSSPLEWGLAKKIGQAYLLLPYWGKLCKAASFRLASGSQVLWEESNPIHLIKFSVLNFPVGLPVGQ